MVGATDEGDLVRGTVGKTSGLEDLVGACFKREGAGVGFLPVLGTGDLVGLNVGLEVLLKAGEFVGLRTTTAGERVGADVVFSRFDRA